MRSALSKQKPRYITKLCRWIVHDKFILVKRLNVKVGMS